MNECCVKEKLCVARPRIKNASALGKQHGAPTRWVRVGWTVAHPDGREENLSDDQFAQRFQCV